ncbi:MAG: CDP-diacylglycerol--glycerol-3-phosphate 3-phosphatidyltransferase [Alphaproteobacteria bacterium]|nr:MAG: CDP-diacylglycerol--glycerol-3-phosphate 3-phosphatidyltransferase [Alphaproteobacteria bacterium]
MSTLPNLLTLSRILVIPLLVATFYVKPPLGNWLALVLFVLAGVTDFLDGYMARSLNQQSHLGRFLDPIADKLLVAAAIVMMVAVDRVSGLTVLAALVILCREILVSGLREFLAELRVRVPVTRLAKLKTAFQFTAIAFLLLGDAAPWNLPVLEIGEVALWIAAGLTLYTGYDYLRGGLHHMSDKEPPHD